MKTFVVIVLLAGLCFPAAADDKAAVSAAKNAVDRGVKFLAKNQHKDGSYGVKPCVGVTGLCVRAMAECHRKYREEDGPFIGKGVEYMLSHVQKDGGIYNKDQGVENYRTCVAITALAALENEKYKLAIENAKKFITGIQCSEDTGYDKAKHKTAYGGTGYGGDQRPDIVNTAFAVEAMKEAGLSKNHPFWKRTLVFLRRLQHNTEGEGNDLEWASDSPEVAGGFIYTPKESKAGTIKLADGREVPRPYGSVTYTGILSLIHADLKKGDPRLKGAVKWMRANFNVNENPGMKAQGLYYYYAVMGKCLYAVGDRYVVDAKGVKHDWAVELSAKLAKLQKPDGSWVNETSRWWESDPVLVTSYSLTALNCCVKALKELK
jgi:squalene-hopene/tetraprenyl-beta-curcumene cyclase